MHLNNHIYMAKGVSTYISGKILKNVFQAFGKSYFQLRLTALSFSIMLLKIGTFSWFNLMSNNSLSFEYVIEKDLVKQIY